jgi:hypothetical protein
MNTEKIRPIPGARDFRDWLQRSLILLRLRPSAVSLEVGGSINLVANFLRQEDRDIHLSTAAKLQGAVAAHAAKRGVALPEFKARADG